MIHYTCDLCKRSIEETRYVVKLESYAALEPEALAEGSDDRDHLEEIHDLLECCDDEHDIETLTGQDQRFDLCAGCFRKFIKNPLGRDATKQLYFSQN